MAEITAVTRTLKSGESVLIRTGEESDAAALRECILIYQRDGEGQLWENGEFVPTVEQEREWILGMKNDPAELLLVAEFNGQIVGNIDFHIGKRKRLAHAGEFGMSCVPEWRGKGLGGLLLAEMLQWARSNPKVEKVNLRVIGSNLRAIALYKKLGFQEEGRKLKEIKYADGTYADEVLMGQFV